jgi:lysozyme
MTGNLTVGYGHNLSASPLPLELYEPDGSISEATADEILEDDINAATLPLVDNCSPWFQQLDPVRQAVLIDLSFNMGWPVLSEFRSTLACFAEFDWQGASYGMLESLWAKQVGQRAVEDAHMVLTGEWPS